MNAHVSYVRNTDEYQAVFENGRVVGWNFVVINNLLKQLSATAKITSPLALGEFFNAGGWIFVLWNDNQIIGIATLVPYPCLTELGGLIDDVVIDENFRGKGLSRTLLQHIIVVAKRSNMQWLELTSRPSRVAANALYPKLGFRKRETNVYQLDLSGA